MSFLEYGIIIEFKLKLEKNEGEPKYFINEVGL